MWGTAYAAIDRAFRLVRPKHVLVTDPCAAEADHPLAHVCRDIGARLTCGSLEQIGGGDADAIVLAHRVTWHTVRRDLNLIADARAEQAAKPPLIFIAIDGEDPIPGWLGRSEHLLQTRRRDLRRQGVELAARLFAGRIAASAVYHRVPGVDTLACLADADTARLIREAFPDLGDRLPPAITEPIPFASDAAPPHGALRVSYILPRLNIGGGVLGALQLANELYLLGIDARLAAWGERSEVYRWRFLRRPLVFGSAAEMSAALPPCDVAVATHWSTAELVRALIDSGRARHGAYFLQDYEAWFFDESRTAQRENVKRTYGLLSEKIVKSDWLGGLLREDGYATHKIPLGLDHGFFYPRPVETPPRPVVMAMARPRTPRRGYEAVLAALAMVKEDMPQTEIVLFGQDLGRMQVPFPYRGEGVVADQDRLAELYSGATVHLDGSDFQAFGRPALEAMACGTANVLTDVGGVSEYARHEENCLLVPPRQPRVFAESILRLLRDPFLRARLRDNGFATVLRYCWKREAQDTAALFGRIARAAPASMPASKAAVP
jgi:glycosyltransferase involved in cell wall biosynthesis